MRSSRLLSYAAGWAVLTVLAAGVVWWGLGPLLAPIMQVESGPTQSQTPSPTMSAPSSTAPSTTSSTGPPVSSSPVKPKVVPSRFEGWSLVDGAFVQTFETSGGRATVRIADGRVQLVSSQPNNGYTVTPRQPSPERLVVEFFDGTHFVVLDAMWWENKPYSKVTQVS